jgi:transcriptional regulator with XRE-family HTH domain
MPWDSVMQKFRLHLDRSGLSVRQIAREVGVTNVTIGRLLSGEVGDPHLRTKTAILRWVQQRDRVAPLPPHTSVRIDDGEYLTTWHEEVEEDEHQDPTPEQELLEYFLENHQQMATLMARSAEGLSPEDRRKVALALLNAFKRMAIEAGEKIPPFLFDLERRFVEE